MSARGIATVILLALPALLAALSPGAPEALQYDRASIAAGELWRVVTCHWTHWSTDHLAWDLAAFAVLILLAWRASPAHTLSIVGLAAVFIPAAVWVALPGLELYRGLSGLDSALFVYVALATVRRELAERRRGPTLIVLLLLAGFLVKVLFETLTGATVFAESAGYVPVPLAHLVGGLLGTALFLAGGRREGQRVQNSHSTLNEGVMPSQ